MWVGDDRTTKGGGLEENGANRPANGAGWRGSGWVGGRFGAADVKALRCASTAPALRRGLQRTGQDTKSSTLSAPANDVASGRTRDHAHTGTLSTLPV